jgi:hypothetical protein
MHASKRSAVPVINSLSIRILESYGMDANYDVESERK